LSYLSDRLLIDHSWSEDPLKQMRERFAMKRVEESPLRGWYGVPFQHYQQTPTMAATFAQSVENIFEEVIQKKKHKQEHKVYLDPWDQLDL